MKTIAVTLVLVVVAVAAAAVVRDPVPPPDRFVSRNEVCANRGGVYGDETVRVRWTRVQAKDGIEVHHCVLRGHDDAELPFLQDAEHLVFTVVSNGVYDRWVTVRFTVRTSAGRALALGPARVRVAPFGQPSCALDLCEAFTEPGERVRDVDVEFLHIGEPVRNPLEHHEKPREETD